MSAQSNLRVLALEPYDGGSHAAFLDGWIQGSEHLWTRLSLPAHHWKWRMRHAPLTFAREIRRLAARGQTWDLLWCSDMLDLPVLRGLVPQLLGILPAVVYFHENQLTYPFRKTEARDLHYAFSNFCTAVAADQIWFNSTYHQHDFLQAFRNWLRRLPDFQPLEDLHTLSEKCSVQWPGVDTNKGRNAQRRGGPLHLLWAARWEFDKGPQAFFSALDKLQDAGIPFRLSVVGQASREIPETFAKARSKLGDRVLDWGFAARDEYLDLLTRVDLVVSTAEHEFFGLSVAEALAAGAGALLPRRLAYPALLSHLDEEAQNRYFYDGSVADLAHCLARAAHRVQAEPQTWPWSPEPSRRAAAPYLWSRRRPALDQALRHAIPATERDVGEQSTAVRDLGDPDRAS